MLTPIASEAKRIERNRNTQLLSSLWMASGLLDETH